MHGWRTSPAIDMPLRLGGGIVLAILWFAGRSLCSIVQSSAPEIISPLELAATILLFLSTCLSMALLLLGAHLFAPVQISDRWKNL